MSKRKIQQNDQQHGSVLNKIEAAWEDQDKQRDALLRLERIGKIVLYTGLVVLILAELIIFLQIDKELDQTLVSDFSLKFIWAGVIVLLLAILFGWVYAVNRLFIWLGRKRGLKNDVDLLPHNSS